MNLYIPVEVKNRELHAKILLAKYAAERGFNVILGRKNDLNDLIMRMPPGIYFGIGAFENFKNFYAQLKRLGFAIFVNEEEGLVTYTDKMYVDMRVSAATLQYVDTLLTWGNENQRVLTEAFPALEQKFKVAGSPRFDLLKAQNNAVYTAEMDEINNIYGRYILVCTCFSSINHFDKKLDYLQSLIEKKTLRTPESIENFKRYSKVKTETYSAFLEAIPKLAALDPKVNIVIRPHPSENAEVYKQCAEQFPNVYVDSRFSVHPWIIRAEALVHHYCTTSIEALAADTPRFALRPQKDSLSEKEIPFACSLECKSADELVARLSGCLTMGKENWQKKANAMQLKDDYTHYVFNMGNASAAEVIVERMAEYASEHKIALPSSGDFRSRMQTLLGKCRYQGKKVVRRAIRRQHKSQHYLSHKFQHLEHHEFDSILRAFPANAELKCRLYAGDFINISRSR